MIMMSLMMIMMSFCRECGQHYHRRSGLCYGDFPSCFNNIINIPLQMHKEVAEEEGETKIHGLT